MQPHRLPAWARAQNSDGQLAVTEAQPAGVRLVLRSQATVLELDALRTTVTYRGAPPRPDGVYELLVDGARARPLREVSRGRPSKNAAKVPFWADPRAQNGTRRLPHFLTSRSSEAVIRTLDGELGTSLAGLTSLTTPHSSRWSPARHASRQRLGRRAAAALPAWIQARRPRLTATSPAWWSSATARCAVPVATP